MAFHEKESSVVRALTVAFQDHPAAADRSPFRGALWSWRAGIATLVLVVFWLDLNTPSVLAIPMFYVVPTLLFMWAGRPWEPAVVAAVATVLTIAGTYSATSAAAPATMLNRLVEILGIWTAAGVVALYRVLLQRWKAAEARLRQQAALTNLGQLTAVVAHEVRNPLAGLRGTLQVLASRRPDDLRERDVINTMIARIDALNAKLTDLLVYARPIDPTLQRVDVGALVHDAVASARAASRSGSGPVEVSGDSVAVRADPDMLRPALLNLLLNACQAGGERPVTVDISRERHTCSVRILDRGPGIPTHVRAHLFEPFCTTKPEGTGLGLSVVKRLIEMQNGTVRVADREGGGTVAELRLPAC
jgi:signal transduction histidine kinase